jgi:uncharacterized membrane protein YhfC
MLTIVFMAISALIGIAVPAVLYVIFRKKNKANHLPFWVGCVTFVLFALVLEQLMYSFLMKTPIWATITGNVWLYGAVGGFFAGLFEETGRYVAFKTVLRKKRGNDANALMYGAGHGGIEAVILLSVSMIVNVIFALQFNAGIPSQLGTLDAGQQMINTPSWIFLVGAVERLSAVTIHVALSVLVWFAAKNNKKFWLFPLAILLHLIVDAVAVILSGLGVNVWIIEGAVFVVAAALVVIAIVVWKKNHTVEQPAVVLEETPTEAQA